MSTQNSDIFICFLRDEDGKIGVLRSGPTAEIAEKILHDEEQETEDGRESNSAEDGGDHVPLIDERTLEDICYRLIQSLDKSLTPYHSAIELATLMRYGLRKAGMESQI